ncbi:hypothetical protein P7K49_029395 [Saguinus oedipus]|uniref:Uncharacterized protein n=1 Tax=Saguinus oedipus TaxID=9490 RepID=A0ABQ9U729_SAGOE|nr:hypothetical protein P7K49_029395 [Saguinus oedipus]
MAAGFILFLEFDVHPHRKTDEQHHEKQTQGWNTHDGYWQIQFPPPEDASSECPTLQSEPTTSRILELQPDPTLLWQWGERPAGILAFALDSLPPHSRAGAMNSVLACFDRWGLGRKAGWPMEQRAWKGMCGHHTQTVKRGTVKSERSQ